MQPQYSQGAAPSHHPPPYAPPEVSQANGGSITSSLRQWRKKDYVEKQQSTDTSSTSANENSSHVARVAPHTYYPRPTNDLCHYQHQYAEYSVPYKPPAPAPVKYSEIVETQQAQTIEHITPMIPKHKEKEYSELCSVAPQPHLKQYPDHLSLKQPYPESVKQTYSDPTVHHQYISKESQMHPFLQKQPPMHQYIQKEPYQQFLQKYNMQGQYSQSYPSEPNNFLAHLNKINPRMAQSIINDAHLRDTQIPMYHNLDQNRSYPQPQRMYQAPPMHTSPTHSHRNIPQGYNYPQPYNYNVKSNMQPGDPYNRVHQYQHNVPKYLPDYKMNEQPIPNISPQRVYNESVHMNYAPMPPKISPNYPHCSQLEYAQHYQHRRQFPQEYYSHPAYKAYVQNPQVSPDENGSDARGQKSSLKQYLENWVDEDMSGNLPDIIVSNNLSDGENMENLKGTMCVKGNDSQEQQQPLYVLDTTEIPNENLPHFLHLQQIEKLPDNIRGYYHSANSLPAASRRIIVENNSEEPPDSNQIIKGNSAPIIPKIPESFTEGAKPVENQRKILSESNQVPNVENKVVQIHIVEEPMAATNSTEVSTVLSAHTKESPSAPDTVIIQPNLYQPNTETKVPENDENCAENVISEVEEGSCSPVGADAKANSVKSMPDIDGNLEETSQDVQSEGTTNSNSSTEECDKPPSLSGSITNIYKEMQHIHGENNSNAEVHENPKPLTDSESQENTEQKIEEENLKSTEAPAPPISLEDLNVNNVEGSSVLKELPNIDVETVVSDQNEEPDTPHVSETVPDVSEVIKDALMDVTDIEIPCASKDAPTDNLEPPQTIESVDESENHRNVSKKLRTAKAPEECLHEKNTIEETPPGDEVEEVNDPPVAAAEKACEKILKKIAEAESKESVTKKSEKKHKRRHSVDSKIKTILRIPHAKDRARRNSAISCQSSDKSPDFANQIQQPSKNVTETDSLDTDNTNMPKINQQTEIESDKICNTAKELEKPEIDVPKAENTTKVTDSVAKNDTDDSTKSDKPISSVDKPVSSIDKPVSSVDKPVSSVDKPVSSVDKPISSTKKVKKCVRFQDCVEPKVETNETQSPAPLNLSMDKKPLKVKDDATHLSIDNSIVTNIINTQVEDICITEFIRTGTDDEKSTIPINMSTSVDTTTAAPFEFVECLDNPNVESESVNDEPKIEDSLKLDDVELKKKKKSKTKTTSSKPEKPVNSSKPEKPVNSSKPEKPVNSSKPEKPVNSSKPEKPVNSSKPEKPVKVERKRHKEKTSQSSTTATDVPRKSRRLNRHSESKQKESAKHSFDKELLQADDSIKNKPERKELRLVVELENIDYINLNKKTSEESKAPDITPNFEEVSNDKSPDSEEKEMPALEAEAPLPDLNCNQTEAFEDTEASVVYQINDTNVVLQIADELLQINITAHNGKKVILVKTFSDAVIMNTSEENECPVLEDQTAVHYEEQRTEIQEQRTEIQEQRISEDQIEANNDDIKTPAVEDVSFMKEICDGSEITSVENDVCIYNEEVVSSSTEIESVPNLVEPVDDKKNLQKKYTTRKSKKEKMLPPESEPTTAKCLTDCSEVLLQKDSLKSKPEPCKEETSGTIKDSLRKVPKTKAALKFVETAIKSSKTKVKDQKVPSKTVDQLKEDADSKKVHKSPKKRLPTPPRHSSIKIDVNSDPHVKIPKEKHHAADKVKHKSESHGNKVTAGDKLEKVEAPKTKERVKPSEKTPKSSHLPLRDEKKMRKPSKPLPVPKPKTKIDLLYKASIERNHIPTLKTDFSIKNLKPKEETTDWKSKNDVKITELIMKLDKISENPKKSKSKPTEEELKKQKFEEKIQPVPEKVQPVPEKAQPVPEKVQPVPEKVQPVPKRVQPVAEQIQPIQEKVQPVQEKIQPVQEKVDEENLVSVQENSITSSTSQDSEALVKERSSKLIQQIADDWEDDSDDLKVADNSCKRRLSLQEYNNRKRTNSLVEQETTQTDLTNNLLDDVNAIIGNKCKRDLSPESPMLCVKFNNKTYSRNTNLYSTKDSASPLAFQSSSKDANATPEPLSSAIELQLPKINRSHYKPVYNQEYLRNALMNDLHTVNALTTTLIKENQQLMQRFLEQQRLTEDELKKVKQIIRYKRLVQHLSTLKINEVHSSNIRDHIIVKHDTDVNYGSNSAHLKFDIGKGQSLINHIVNPQEKPTTVVSRPHLEDNVKVQFKKTNPERRKRKRFRFLYSDDETDLNDSPTFSSAPPLLSSQTKLDKDFCLKRPRLDNTTVPALDSNVVDYSVHQGNSQGQLTLVFKRSFKSDPRMQPFVKLERLSSIDQLAKSKFYK